MNRLFRVFGLLCIVVCTASGQVPIAATRTTLDIAAGGSAVSATRQGTGVTLTATVTTAGVPVVRGQINFCDAAAKLCSDIHLYGTAQLSAAGTATLHFVPGPGTHSYKAVFPGTTNEAGSASAIALLTVAAAPLDASRTALIASGAPGKYVLTATVTGKGSIAPTGTVAFLDTSNSSAVLATAPLSPQAGTGTLDFRNSSQPATNPYPQSVVVADFNSDGKLDLAVPVYSIGTGLPILDIFLGNGDGTFRAAPQIPVWNTNAGYAAAADFNGDGKTDLAVTLPDNNAIEVLLGKGDGTFTALPLISAANIFTLAAADLNGDGLADLVTANPGGKNLTVLFGNGDGTFTAGPTLATANEPTWVTVGDFNGDGIPDLATTLFPYQSGVLGSGTGVPGSVEIFLGRGNGNFVPVTASPEVGYSPADIIAGDWNGDGKLDLAVANLASDTSHPATVTVLMGEGDGTFTSSTQTLLTGNLPYSVASGDFNGDGIPDLVTANSGSNTATVLLGSGDGRFTNGPVPSMGVNPVGAAVGDFNGDGLSDIAGALNYPDFEAPVLLAQESETQTATATVNRISIVGTGTHLVDADYPGDGNYLPSVSGTVALTATASVLPAFGLTAQPATQSVAAGGTATYNLTVTPQNGFNQAVNLSCSATNPRTKCSFSPATVPGGSGTSTLTVQTAATLARNGEGPARRKPAILAAGFLLLFLPLGAWRQRPQVLLSIWLIALLAGGAAALTGCNASLLQTAFSSSSTRTILVTGATTGAQPTTATVAIRLTITTSR